MLVSLMAGKAEVKYDSDVLDAVAVAELIEHLGFGAKLIEDDTVTHGKLDLTVSLLDINMMQSFMQILQNTHYTCFTCRLQA